MFLQDCADVADFFTELVEAVGDVSLQLQGDDTVQVVDGMVHPYKGTTWLCPLPLRGAQPREHTSGWPCRRHRTRGWQGLCAFASEARRV